MFITFEGIDFCGKSTQVTLLEKFLISSGKKVVVLREPGGTEISEKIREILLDKKNLHLNQVAEIFLFSAARAQLVREKIKPLLEEGAYVISDRFHDSTTAYQGFGRGIDLNYVESINNLAIGDVIPDLTFFIDLPLEQADQRKAVRNNLDRMEVSDSSFYSRVREGYLYLAQKEKRFKLLDGTKSIDDIFDEIKSEIEKVEKTLKNYEKI